MNATIYPGRVRIVVNNDQGGSIDYHGLLWGFRSRYYSNAAGAALAYEAEALTPLDAGTIVARSGATNGTVVRHPSLPGGAWCPVLSTNIGGSAYLTHQGTYRVWARCYSGTAVPQLKFLWDVGDLTGPTTNDTVQVPGAANFYMLDFGQIRIDAAPVGTHRWAGVFQAKAANQGDQVEIDRVWFQPLDDGAGKLVAVQQDSALGINYFKYAGTAADDATVGTNPWNNTQNVPGASDGLYATAGSTASTGTTHYLKATNFGFNIPTGATISGIKVFISKGSFGSGLVVDNHVYLVKAGVIQAVDRASATPWGPTIGGFPYGGQTDLWGGTWTPADINNSGFGVALSASWTFGGLSTVIAGIDYVEIVIYYTTSGGFTTTADAVIYSTRTAECRTDGMYRVDVGGTSYAPISQVVGDLPRVPPAGAENRTLQVFLKPSRGNFTTEPDSGIDDISARIYYRPSWLTTN
jgi:hypothetical protein